MGGGTITTATATFARMRTPVAIRPKKVTGDEYIAVAVDVGNLQMDKIDIETLKQAYERE